VNVGSDHFGRPLGEGHEFLLTFEPPVGGEGRSEEARFLADALFVDSELLGASFGSGSSGDDFDEVIVVVFEARDKLVWAGSGTY